MSHSTDVALFIRWMRGGGAERVTANIAAGLARSGLQVDLVLLSEEGQYLSELPPEVRIVDLNTRSLSNIGGIKLPTSFQALGSLQKLTTYLKTVQPAVLLSATHYLNEVSVLAKRLARVPTRVIVSEHTTLSLEAQHTEYKSARFLPWTTRLVYPFADEIVAVSHGVAEDLSQTARLGSKPIQVIYNPVLTSELFAQAQAPVEHPWFNDVKTPIVLGSGRFVRQKNFQILIRAFAQVRQQQPARLVLLGSGRDRPALQSLIHTLGITADVWFPGFVKNPYAYVAKSTVFVLSSSWEGLPTTLIEAMGLGIPVVSTDCPSGPAEILGQGQYGELVPMDDVTAMAEAIARVLQGQQKSVPAHHLHQFTPEAAIARYRHLLFGSPIQPELSALK